MKQKLHPGVELDLLTEDEVRRVVEEATRRPSQPAQVRGATISGGISAAGTISFDVYRVPLGMGFKLTRLLVDLEGTSPGVPAVAAFSYMQVLRNDVMVDFKSLVAAAVTPNGLPALFTYGEDSACYLANGDQLSVFVALFDAQFTGKRVEASIEGILRPIVLGN